jgi:hypothetical protein
MFFESTLDYGWLCWCRTSEVWMQAIILTKYEFVIQILESGCCLGLQDECGATVEWCIYP